MFIDFCYHYKKKTYSTTRSQIIILTLSADPEACSLVRDGAHKKWHLIRTLRIREEYRALDTKRRRSEILSGNCKVKFKRPNECKQQDFHSIIHEIETFRTRYIQRT